MPLLSCETTGDGDPGQSPEVRAFTAAETAEVAPALADENPLRFVEDDGTEGGRVVPSDIELIYEEIRTQDGSDRELTRETRGTLTLEIWQRTSHPQFYLDASEPYVYHEEGGTTYLEDGTQRHHYRIRRQPNRSQAEKPVTLPGPPRVDAVVFEKWAEAAGDGSIELNARLSGIPDYQPPPIPPPGMFPAEDDRRAQAQRDAYLLSYYENFNTRAGRFQAEIENAGGHVVELMADIGWVRIRVPSKHVERLLEHPEIDRLTSPYVETRDSVTLEREAVLQVIRSGAGISTDDLAEALSEKFDFTPDMLSLHLLALQTDELVMNHGGVWTPAEAPAVATDEPPVESRNTDE